MRKIVQLLMMLVFVLALAGCSSEAEEPGYAQISTEEALTIMEEQEDYVLLDVRTPEEFAEKHIVGAINVPNEEIDTSPIAALPDLDQVILIYCRSGNRSKEASEKLVQLGYTQVYEFGGINDWSGKICTGENCKDQCCGEQLQKRERKGNGDGNGNGNGNGAGNVE